MRNQRFFALVLSFISVGCSRPSTMLLEEDAGKVADAAAAPLAERNFGPLQMWQTPIADYIERASKKLSRVQLHKAIDDLMVFDGRLYLGYGDANLNAGEVTPIQIRSWQSPSDTAPTAESIAGVDQKYVATKASSEEEIALYRRFGDHLYIPGVDAMQDDFVGNVFDRPVGGGWTRHRSVQAGVHVQDIAEWHGELYACGAGTLNLDDWNLGMEHSWLWRSSDGGEHFSAEVDQPNPNVGDRRLTALLPLDNALYAFGYSANQLGSLDELLAVYWDGKELRDTPMLGKRIVAATDVFTSKIGIVRTTTAVGLPVHCETLRVEQGAATAIPALDQKTVLDISVMEPGRAVLIVTDGDVVPLSLPLASAEVLYTEDFVHFKSLLSFVPASLPTAIAVFQDGIYVGLDDGSVWRSLPAESAALIPGG